MKKYSIIGIFLAMLISCNTEGDSNLPTGTVAVTIGAPPTFTADAETRLAVDHTAMTTTWETGDQINITLVCTLASGAEITQHGVAQLNSDGWGTDDLTWPVANIASVRATASYNLTDGVLDFKDRPAFVADNFTAIPGQPIAFNFSGAGTHRTAGIHFSGYTAGQPVVIDGNPYGTIGDDGTLAVYVIPTAGATAISGTVDGRPFSIPITGDNNRVGSISYVKQGTNPGPGRFKELMEAQRFLAWATKYNAETSGPTDKDFTLECDIDLSSFGEWTPIGANTNPYTGVFNGGGHTITGLKISSYSNIGVGLFGVTGTGAVLANVIIEEPEINVRKDNVGALVGQTSGTTTITNCGVTGGSVTGNGNVGGLIGSIGEDNHVVGCYSSASVKGVSPVGGLIGDASYFTARIIASYSTGTVQATENSFSVVAGGLIGWNVGTVCFCYATGLVTAETLVAPGGGFGIGGLVGVNYSDISSCYAKGGVSMLNVTAGDTASGNVSCLVGGGSGSGTYCVAGGTVECLDGETFGYTAAGIGNIAYTDDAAALAVLQAGADEPNPGDPGVVNVTGVRVYDATAGTVETVSIDKDVWGADLRLK